MNSRLGVAEFIGALSAQAAKLAKSRLGCNRASPFKSRVTIDLFDRLRGTQCPQLRDGDATGGLVQHSLIHLLLATPKLELTAGYYSYSISSCELLNPFHHWLLLWYQTTQVRVRICDTSDRQGPEPP